MSKTLFLFNFYKIQNFPIFRKSKIPNLHFSDFPFRTCKIKLRQKLWKTIFENLKVFSVLIKNCFLIYKFELYQLTILCGGYYSIQIFYILFDYSFINLIKLLITIRLNVCYSLIVHIFSIMPHQIAPSALHFY
jgi:hypothetical protein